MQAYNYQQEAEAQKQENTFQDSLTALTPKTAENGKVVVDLLLHFGVAALALVVSSRAACPWASAGGVMQVVRWL